MCKYCSWDEKNEFEDTAYIISERAEDGRGVEFMSALGSIIGGKKDPRFGFSVTLGEVELIGVDIPFNFCPICGCSLRMQG